MEIDLPTGGTNNLNFRLLAAATFPRPV